MKLRTISKESTIVKLTTVGRELRRDGEDESSKGFNVGTKSDRPIRALASDPQNTFK
jgi:hypothetical protein